MTMIDDVDDVENEKPEEQRKQEKEGRVWRKEDCAKTRPSTTKRTGKNLNTR